MKTTKENIEKSRIKLTIEISEKEWRGYEDRAYFRLANDVDLKGFRPGKAPKDLIINKIGKDKLFSESLEIAVQDSFAKTCEQEKIRPIGSPEVKLEKYEENQPIKYTASFDTLPEVQLPDYKKIKVKKEIHKISEKDLEVALKNLQKNYAEYSEKKDPATAGDRVEIDFEGFDNNVKLDSLSSKNHPLVLGEGMLIAGFEDKIIGLKAGDEKEFNLTLPKTIQDPGIAGKTFKFKIKVNMVQKVTLPKLDDEFAKKFGKFQKFDELKDDVKKAMESRADENAQKKLEIDILEKISKDAECDLPQSLVDAEQAKMFQNIVADIESRGLKFEDYLKSIKTSEEEVQKNMKNQAEKAVKIALIINTIRDQEKIKVSEDEILAEIEKIKNSGQKVEDSEHLFHQVENVLANRKTINLLIKFASK